MYEDVLADLPPPFDDEPPSLRQDIADELHDHLACAFHRELVKTADEQTAKSRVLERFGDPRRIARQLWWQALWSRIMLQKVSIGIQSVMTVALLVLVAMLFRLQAHQQQMAAESAQFRAQSASQQATLMQLVQQLRELDLPRREPAAAGAPAMGSADASTSMMGDGMAGMMMPGMPAGAMSLQPPLPSGAASLSLVLTMEAENGSPAHGCLVAVFDDADRQIPLTSASTTGGMTGMSMGGMGMSGLAGLGGGFSSGSSLLTVPQGGAGYWLGSESLGRLETTPIDPGRYVVVVEFPNGWYTHRRVIVPPGVRHVEKIVCPQPAEKAFVTITAPAVPQDLRTTNEDGKAATVFDVELIHSSELQHASAWRLMASHFWNLTFDAETGLLNYAAGDAPIVRMTGDGKPKTHDFTGETAAERFLVLPTGPYSLNVKLVRWSGTQDLELARLGVGSLPRSVEPGLTFTLQPGQNTWSLDRAAELFDEARKKLAETGISKPTF